MKIVKLGFGGFLVIVLLGFSTVAIANAQFPGLTQWEGKWFKLSIKTTENIYNGVKIETDIITSVIYLGITKFNPPAELIGVVWQQYEEDPGSWEQAEINMKVVGGTDLDFLCAYMQSVDSLDNPYYFGFSARVTGKLSKGVLKSATLKTLGGFSWEQNFSLNSEYFASGFSISGNLIDPSKLPFTL
jgi:hypothetical protein